MPMLLLAACSARQLLYADSAPPVSNGSKTAATHSKKAAPKKRAKKAKNPLTSLSLAALGNIEFTSVSKEPEEVWQTPAAIYVLTQDDIRRSGATTIPDLLRLVPGVEVAQMDSGHWAVAIRGFNSQFSRYMLVLIDGRNVYSPLQGGVYWEGQMVPLEDIDRIEVIRGPGGTIWGSNAVNGVINIITKNSKDTHGTMITAGGGNIDRGGGDYRFGGSAGKSFDYRVYGMGFDRGPEFHLDHDPFDYWVAGQAGFRADWKPGSSDSVTFQGELYRGNDGTRTAYATYSPPAQNNLDGAENLSGGDLQAYWKHSLQGGSDVQIRAYFDQTDLLAPALGEVRDTFDVDFVHHLLLPHGQDFLWGLGADLSPRTITQTIPTIDLLPHRLTDEVYSGFVQDRIPLVENRLWLTVGSKIEHDNYTGFELEPSARLLWALGPRQTMWGAVTRAVRTPADIDEGFQLTGFLENTPSFPLFLQVLGTGHFGAEQLIGYEVGYRRLIRPPLYLDVAAFHNDYNYLESYGLDPLVIETQPLRVVIPFPWVNGLMGSTEGFELGPDWRPRSWWDLKGSYSYLDMNLRTRPGFVDSGFAATDAGSSPHSEVVLQSQFNLPAHLEFDQTYRYVGALPAIPIPSYGTADVHLGWRATPHLTLSLAGQNLLQPRHAEFMSSEGVPVEIQRSVFAKITWQR